MPFNLMKRIIRLQWSHVFSDMVRAIVDYETFISYDASMEPCLFRHGKTTALFSIGFLGMLQWSHVFSDMVSLSSETVLGRPALASMEPCLFRHGKMGCHRITQNPGLCFNGAMSFQTW